MPQTRCRAAIRGARVACTPAPFGRPATGAEAAPHSSDRAPMDGERVVPPIGRTRRVPASRSLQVAGGSRA